MIGTRSFDRRQLMQFGAGALSGLAITAPAIAQTPKSGPAKSLAIGSGASLFGEVFNDVLKHQGYFEKYGVTPKFLNVSDGAKTLAAVLSGDVDLVHSGFGPVLTAIEKGGALKLIAGNGTLIVQALYTSKPDIKTLKDLEGRIVGTGQPGALLHQMTVALLRKRGVDVDKVTFVNIGSSADVFRAVVAGTIDAGPGQNDVFGEQDKWGIHSLAEFWTDLPEYPYNAFFTSDRAIAEKRAAIVGGLAAFGELYRYLQGPDSWDVFSKAYHDESGGKGEETAAYQWKFMQQYKPYGLLIPEEGISYLQNLNLQMGIQKTIMPIDKVADLSMAQEALKMIG